MDIRDTSIKIPAMSPEYIDADDYITADVADEELTDRAYWEQERKKVLWDFLIFFAAVVIVAIAIGTVAWFASNKDVGGNGMAVQVQGMPYTIQTRDSSGYYSTIYETLNTGGLEWKISSTDNFANHESAKKEGETEPGLEPGDHGTLEFRVNPNTTNTITVDCIFDMKAYLETTTTDEQANLVTAITEIDDSALVGYLKAHIMLFAGFNSDTGKYTGLISNDESLRRVLANQTYIKDEDVYTKIYWVWPEHLSDLTNADHSKIIYDYAEFGDVMAYIASNKDGFFKGCNDSAAQVEEDLTALSDAYSSAIYNHYNMRYDNADLDIGNNISYVMLSMQVAEQ